MGCKVQSIWHIWTLLLLPFVKLQHFLHSSAGTQTITSGMFWSYLKFLITFFFIYYIFYIFYCKTHFAAVYSLLTLEGSAHLQVPEGQQLRCWLPAAAVLPQGGAAEVRGTPSFLPGGRGGRAVGLRRGHGQDTREAAARWAALQTLYSCFLHGIPKKVMWLSPGDESTFWDTGIKLHCTWTARLNQVLRTFFFLSPQQGENTSAYIYKSTPNYYVNTACWSGYFSFMVGQQK